MAIPARALPAAGALAPGEAQSPEEPVCRPVRPTDAPALAAFYVGLSQHAYQQRFHGAAHLSSEAIAAFAAADGQASAGWVAQAGEAIVGHLVLVSAGRADSRELGIAVSDSFQNQGLGTRLCDLAVAWSHRHGVRVLVVPVRWGNAPMERLVRHLGPACCESTAGVETFLVDLPLS
jgi:RimJ/RimL family protein N-acetyltransferase